MFTIVANVISDKGFRTGAKVRFISCNSDVHQVEVRGLNKSGRSITKFIACKRLKNFRAAFLPDSQREHVIFSVNNYDKVTKIFWDTKEEANDVAQKLTTMWEGVRFFHRDGTMLQEGITEGEAVKRFKDDANYKYRHISQLSFIEQRKDEIRRILR